MALEDEKHTSFRMPINIFCYTVMPFGLKNAGVTYQRAMTRRLQPFSKLMKKDVRFKWDEECQDAFNKIEGYLLNPSILTTPIPGKPLILSRKMKSYHSERCTSMRHRRLNLPDLQKLQEPEQTPTKTTPYSLVFGVEAVLLLEIELSSLQVTIQNDLIQEQNARLRMEEFNALDELRLQAQQNLEIYREKMTKSFDRMVRPRAFQEEELILVLRRPIITHRRIGGKFVSNWEGPFVIEKLFQGEAYQLIDLEGQRPMPPINGRYLKKYYA
ncbi:uncharacterized protein LOC114579981 [Dendrobium catenatum]|uniref:uncharacterized protein LOC114579981 n=1 Tax=Dendrobium catenatum TaxID=906689 RepID=UPI0010A00B58|nr:uncharacterized protein LOC114579981 [Dendrobium catenatum]